jgi:hypothetical protein
MPTLQSRPGMFVVALAGAASCMGCGADTPDRTGEQAPQAVVVRDSAGVRMVENRLDTALLPRWTPDRVETSLGAVVGAPAHEFGSIVAAVRLADGSVAVADQQALEIRIFGADGTHVRTVGGPGEGPGEFRRISSLGAFAPDSLVVWDHALRRATVLAGDGEVMRTVRLSPPADAGGPPTSTRLGPVMPGEGNRWTSVAYPHSMRPRVMEATMVRDPVFVLLHDSTGSPSGTVATSEYETLLVPPADPRVQAITTAQEMVPPGAVRSYTALTPTEVYVATSERFRIEVFGLEGTLRRVITYYPLLERAYTDQEFNEARERASRTASTPEQQRAIEYMFDPRFKPPRHPAMSGLRVSTTGHVWVRIGESRRWLVIDPAGAAKAIAEIPTGLSVLELGPDAAVVGRRDELGVDFVDVRGWTRR